MQSDTDVLFLPRHQHSISHCKQTLSDIKSHHISLIINLSSESTKMVTAQYYFIWQMRNHIKFYSHLLITNAQWQSRHTAGGQHAIVCHSKRRYVRSGELWSAHQWLVNVHWHQTLTGSGIDQSIQITTKALYSNIGSISQRNLTHWWILRRSEPHLIIFLRGPAPHVPGDLASIEKATSKYGFMMRSGGLGYRRSNHTSWFSRHEQTCILSVVPPL